MRTKLIEGMAPSRLDKDLLLDIESIKLPPDTLSKGAFLIGVRDEHGDIYRTIEINGETNAAYAITQLRGLGYRDEAPNFQETEMGYDLVLSVVKAGKLRR
jgi:hypothetical protein